MERGRKYKSIDIKKVIKTLISINIHSKQKKISHLENILYWTSQREVTKLLLLKKKKNLQQKERDPLKIQASKVFTNVLITNGLTLREAEHLQSICNFTGHLVFQNKTFKNVERVTL